MAKKIEEITPEELAAQILETEREVQDEGENLEKVEEKEA